MEFSGSSVARTPLAASRPIPARVAIVAPEGLSGRGGIGRVMTYLVRHLRAHADHLNVRVYASRFAEQAPLSHLSVPFALLWMVVGLVVHQIDVVHINVAPRGSTWRKMLFARVARLLGRRVILHLHGSGYDQYFATQGARRQRLICEFFHASDRVVVLSGFWRRFALETLRLPTECVVEIPNGVPNALDTFSPRQMDGEVRITFLGEVGPRKGVDVLLEALTQIAPDAPRWKVVLGGNGDVAGAQARAAALELADRVTFLGWIGEATVNELLGRTDIFVLPSRAENQPISILEAMARGVPVVSTPVGAIPDQVIDGETGILAAAGDAPALAAALTRLIGDEALRSRMGAAGHARFVERFSAAACADHFAKLYRELA